MEIVYEIEAILFLYGDELEIERLEKFFEIGKKELIEALGKLKALKEKSGVNLKIKEGKVSLVTNPEYGETLFNFFNPKPKPKKLSKAALETLTIIAYRQPVPKSEMEKIRGVKVDGVIQSLEERDLIYVSGIKEGSGKAKLYSVTKNFLKYLRINSLEELPNYNEIRNGDKNEDKQVSS